MKKGCRKKQKQKQTLKIFGFEIMICKAWPCEEKGKKKIKVTQKVSNSKFEKKNIKKISAMNTEFGGRFLFGIEFQHHKLHD